MKTPWIEAWRQVQLALLLALALALVPLPVLAEGPSSAADDAAIDIALQSFDNPVLWRLLTEVPEPPFDPPGPQPFKQQPPDAQETFSSRTPTP